MANVEASTQAVEALFTQVFRDGNYVTVSAIGIYTGKCPPIGTANLTTQTCETAEGTLKAGWLEMDSLGLLQQLGAVKPLQEIVPNLRY